MEKMRFISGFVGALVPLALVASASAVENGTIPDCNDRRFDCVGLVRRGPSEPFCTGGSINGSCVLIDRGERDAEGVLVRGARVLCADHSVCPNFPDHRIRFRRSANGNAMNGYFSGGGLPENDCNGEFQEYGVTSIEHHPNSSCPSGSYDLSRDLAILTLDSDVTYIRPASLDLDTELDELPGIIAGWGYSAQPPNVSDHWRLRRGDVTITTSSSLGVSWSGTFGLLHDSGGGLFIEVANPNSDDPRPELHLVGIIQFPLSARRVGAWNDLNPGTHLSTTPVLTAGGLSDFNRDGTVSIQDIFDFLNAWFAVACIADVNIVDGISQQDIYDFLAAWFAAR